METCRNGSVGNQDSFCSLKSVRLEKCRIFNVFLGKACVTVWQFIRVTFNSQFPAFQSMLRKNYWGTFL